MRGGQQRLTRLSFPLETSQFRSGRCVKLVIIELWFDRTSFVVYSCVERERDQMYILARGWSATVH